MHYGRQNENDKLEDFQAKIKMKYHGKTAIFSGFPRFRGQRWPMDGVNKINILSIFDTIKHFRRIFHTCQVLKVRLRDIAKKFFEPHSGEKNFLDLLGGMLPQKILIG